MKLIYPAIFTPYFDEGGYDVTVPDLPDCIASGDTLGEAIEDAVKQASGVILSIMEKGGDVPPASEYQDVVLEDPDDRARHGSLFGCPRGEVRAQKHHDPGVAERIRGGAQRELLQGFAGGTALHDAEEV